MDKFTLKSNPLCLAPGMMRFCEQLAKCGQEDIARNVIAAWNEDPRVADAVLAGEYEVKGEMVIVECEERPADVFAELYARTKHKVKEYETDFDHDRDLIDRMGNDVPFIHIAREMGTHLIMFPPANHKDWPAKGETAPYLFATVDRYHMLGQVSTMVAYHKRHHPEELWTYYNGWRLMVTNPDEACRICSEYVKKISLEWANDS